MALQHAGAGEESRLYNPYHPDAGARAATAENTINELDADLQVYNVTMLETH